MSVRTLRNGVTAYVPDRLTDGSYSNAADEWAQATGGHYTTGPDGQVYAYEAPGFIGTYMPWIIGAGMGVGALANAGVLGSLAAGGSGATSALPATIPGSYASTAYGAGAFGGPAAAGTGAGMHFGLGSLAHFFDSRGGATLVDAAGNLIGSGLQARAAGHAAELQSDAAQRALDEAIRERTQAMADYNAWLNGPALATLGDLVGVGRGAATPSMPMSAPMTIAQMRTVGSGQTPAAMANRGMVRMQAPDGEVRLVSAAAVPKYLARGVRVIG